MTNIDDLLKSHNEKVEVKKSAEAAARQLKEQSQTSNRQACESIFEEIINPTMRELLQKIRDAGGETKEDSKPLDLPMGKAHNKTSVYNTYEVQLQGTSKWARLVIHCDGERGEMVFKSSIRSNRDSRMPATIEPETRTITEKVTKEMVVEFMTIAIGYISEK